MDLSGNNVFLYWVGKEYKLITLLRKLIYLYSKKGRGYTVHLITAKNIETYLTDIPECFDKLCPAHQADYVRVNIIYKYGGIWLDSDTLVLEPLDILFNILHEKNGFFITEGPYICNGIFGSRAGTEIIRIWKSYIDKILHAKQHMIHWTELGASILTHLYRKNYHLYLGYTIMSGAQTVMPSHWRNSVKDLLELPEEASISFEREFQPVFVLYNSVYKAVEPIENFRSMKNPLNYFINKSIKNLGDCDIDI